MTPVLRPITSLLIVAALVSSVTLSTDTVVVAAGDTLGALAMEHQVSVADLVDWNAIENPDRIVAGTRLIVGNPQQEPPEIPITETYTITVGDTLSLIAARFGVAMVHLIEINSIANPDVIRAGQLIVLGSSATTTSTTVPAAAVYAQHHVVASGETLSGIAVRYGVKTGVLARANSITNLDQIRVGTTLVVPTAAIQTTTTTAPTATTAPPATTTPTATTQRASYPTAAPAPPPSTTQTTTPPDRGAVGIQPLSPLFEKWSTIYAVPRGLLEAIAWHESNWNPGAVGDDGRLGITQLRPSTVAFIESNLLGGRLDPLASSDGIQLAARYLRYLIDRSSSDHRALAAWQQGLTSVQRDGVSDAARRFADDVIGIWIARS